MNPFKRQSKTYLQVKCDLCGKDLDNTSDVEKCDLVSYKHTHLYHVCKENTTSNTFMGKTFTSARAYRFYCPKIDDGKYWGGDVPPHNITNPSERWTAWVTARDEPSGNMGLSE